MSGSICKQHIYCVFAFIYMWCLTILDCMLMARKPNALDHSLSIEGTRLGNTHVRSGCTAEAHAAAAAAVSNRNRTLQAASQRLLRRPKTYSAAAVHSACTTCVLPAVSAPLCSTSSVVEYFNMGTVLDMQ
jgi:hypothetical protein